MAPDLRLKVDGVLYGGWQSIRVTRSIEQLAGAFELSVTERWSGQDTVRPIRPGAACQILIDDVPVITGYIDDVRMSYDSGSHTVSVSGRDKAGDLVDCSAAFFPYVGMSLLSIATRLCKPFGIAVIDEAKANGAFSTLRPNPGDSVFTSLDACAKVRGVLIVSDGNGGIVITRASKTRIGAALVLGENILSSVSTFSHKDRFSEYSVATQQEMLDGETYGTQAIHIMAKAQDAAVERYRPLTVINDKLLDRKQAHERATWERKVRYGKGQRIQYIVNGWHYDADTLWPINRLVAVKDEHLSVDFDLLIVGTTFTLDDRGFRTDLTLSPRDGFDLLQALEGGDLWDSI